MREFQTTLVNKYILKLIICTILCAVSIADKALAAISLTEDSAIQMAQEKNPELRAARLLVAEAEGRGKSTGRLSNPELETEIAGGQEFEGRVTIGLNQRFPLTSRLRLERQLSALEIEAATWEVRERAWQLSTATRVAFYELAAAREAARLAEQQANVATAFSKTLRSGVDEGFGALWDAEQAALDADEIRISGSFQTAEIALASARLATLLGMSAETEIQTQTPLALPSKLPAERVSGLRPDVQLAKLAVESGATGVTLARAARWEDVGVGLFVEGERFGDEPEGIEPEALIGVRFSIPLPLWQNGSGQVAEKQAAAERSSDNLEAIQIKASSEITSAYRVMRVRYAAAKRTTEELTPTARKHIETVEAAYARGEADVQTVFRARERLTVIESAAIEARKQYFLAHAEWLHALGEISKP